MPKQPAKYKVVISGKQPIYCNDFRLTVKVATEKSQRYGHSSVTIYTWNSAKQSYVIQ